MNYGWEGKELTIVAARFCASFLWSYRLLSLSIRRSPFPKKLFAWKKEESVVSFSYARQTRWSTLSILSSSIKKCQCL